jgi:flavin-dependent dehydrogenase
MSDFQVIIIGGRPAGASLAIRLGKRNIKTLLLDKMTFPSLPGVPSSPIMYSQHIAMLEELGFSEHEVFHPDGRIDTFAVSFVGHFNAAIPMSIAGVKHPYAYGADRNKFDMALWDRANTYESVTARSGFAVTGVLKENGKVIGIKGQTERGKEETITADLVVGADGRFSFAAQQFEAPTIEEHNENITSSYHAEWENVADGIAPHAGMMYNTAKGLAVLAIPIDTRKYIIGTYLRPSNQKSDKRIEDSYLDALQGIPDVSARLKDAKRVTPVVGVKGIRNGIRQPAGNGWALVGDAFHYKDPLDGQGIYDALLEAKYLDEAIHQWQSGDQSWDQVGQAYAQQVIAATRPMMLQTVSRVKKEMFSDPPPFIIKTMIRWMLTNPEYQRDFLRLLTRASDPAKWETPGVAMRAIKSGIMNDLFGRTRRTGKRDQALGY